MMLILRWFNHKIADFATFTLEVCRLIRYGEKREKNHIRNFKKKIKLQH